MRHWVVLVLFLFALGTLRVVGCGDLTAPWEWEPECQIDEDCDDRNECTDDLCVGDCFNSPARDYEVCADGDDNECTYGRCDDGVCTTRADYSHWLEDATPCESDGTPGACWCGVCKVEPPECVMGGSDPSCDDDNECTEGYCECGLCEHRYTWTACDPCDRNGVPGVCILGVCEEPKCLTNEECDDGIACTNDVCDDCRGCRNPVNCWDDNDCTYDICDRDTGGCSSPIAADGTGCGRCVAWEPCGFPPLWTCCTGYQHCQNGECV